MSILGAMGGMLARGVILRTEGTLLGPPETQLRQDVNRQFTNDLPGPEAIFAAYNQGLIELNWASQVVSNSNIDWNGRWGAGQANFHQCAWEAARRATIPVPGIEAAMRGWAHGLLDTTLRDKLIKRAGSDPELWQWARSLALSVPDPGTINQAFTRGYIDFDEWKKLLLRSGARDFHWNAVLAAYESVPSIAETISLYNRRLIDDQQLDSFLHRNGLADQTNRELIKTLRHAIPSISDLITMQVREVFNPELANSLGLYDESPSSIIPYFEAQGLNWGVTLPDRVTPLIGNVDGNPRPLTWPDLYWGMHWRPFSPEQVFRMWHVLRPERIQRYKGRGLNVEPADLDFVRRWLRIQDYPPRVRDYLAAIAFQPLRLIDIRAALATGVAADAWAREQNVPPAANPGERELFSRRWAVQQFLDRGVHPDDAEVQADLALEAERRKRLTPIPALQRSALSKLLQQVISHYRIGIITSQQATVALRDQGIPETTIALVIQNTDRDVSELGVKETLKLIRRRYLDGITDGPAVREELNRAGITAERGTQYINLWTAQRNQRSRMVTTAKIQEWARMGLLSPQEAQRRLDNLGWSDSDVILHLAEIQADVNQIQARQAQAALKSQRSQAAELQRLIKANQQQAARMQSELRRLSPVSTLKKWLRLNIISESFFATRMAAMGYPADEIARHLAEVYSSNGQQATEDSQERPPQEETSP